MAYHDINSLDWLYSQGRVLRPSKLRFGNSSMGTNMFDGICIAALKIFKDILCSRITRLQIINMSKTDKNQFHDIKLIELELWLTWINRFTVAVKEPPELAKILQGYVNERILQKDMPALIAKEHGVQFQ